MHGRLGLPMDEGAWRPIRPSKWRADEQDGHADMDTLCIRPGPGGECHGRDASTATAIHRRDSRATQRRLIGNTIEPSIPRRLWDGRFPCLLGAGPAHSARLARLRQTEAMREDLGADDVETRIYPGANHGINQQEPDKARRVVVGLCGS
jgi:hypothetical protein